MVKVAMGLMSAAAMLVAAPAMAHGQEIPNDLDRCGADARGPAVLVDVRGFAAATGKVRLKPRLPPSSPLERNRSRTAMSMRLWRSPASTDSVCASGQCSWP